MTPIYLRFASEAEALGALEGAAYAARDNIGTLYLPAPSEDADPVPLEGWHVNLIVDGDLPEALVPFAVVPHAPQRRFAGY